MTQEDVNRRIKDILDAAGIDCLITGRITAAFPGGDTCHYVRLDVEARGFDYQRGLSTNRG